MKTSQSYIARIEGAKVRPSSQALERFARATRTRLRLAAVLRRRGELGPNAFVFGTDDGDYVASFKTAWESLLLIANGHDTKRAKPGARVDRARLQQIDLHWHDLRHEGACRLLADGVDIVSSS